MGRGDAATGRHKLDVSVYNVGERDGRENGVHGLTFRRHRTTDLRVCFSVVLRQLERLSTASSAHDVTPLPTQKNFLTLSPRIYATTMNSCEDPAGVKNR